MEVRHRRCARWFVYIWPPSVDGRLARAANWHTKGTSKIPVPFCDISLCFVPWEYIHEMEWKMIRGSPYQSRLCQHLGQHRCWLPESFFRWFSISFGFPDVHRFWSFQVLQNILSPSAQYHELHGILATPFLFHQPFKWSRKSGLWTPCWQYDASQVSAKDGSFFLA